MARRSMKKRSAVPPAPAREEGILTTEYTLPGERLRLIHAAIIVLAGLWIYSPAFHGDWIWDDTMYLSENPLLNDPARLWKAWFEPGSFIEYYPIEQTVQWLQWQLWGDDTLGYHLSNVALHLVSAMLVWRLLSKMGLQLAWLGGLIFAIHPMMVESVAWISELKNTLSLPPFLLAMCAWIDYENGGRRADYLKALALFLTAMLCKIAFAPFPVFILLYAWWKRGRIAVRDVRASVPFFAISLLLSFVTQWSGTVYLHNQLKNPAAVDIGGVFFRLALSGQTLANYFAKCFWPVGPIPIYPQWKVDPSSPISYLPWLVLAGVCFWCWRNREGWGRHVLLGLGFFILFLGPFLGFLPISYLSFTWVMDHFLYVSIIGIIGLVVAGIETIDARLATAVHPISTGILTVIMGLLAFESHWYASAFTNQETFWTYTVERNPGAWLAQNNLGKILLQSGQPDKARERFVMAIRSNPEVGEPYCNLGTALAGMGQIPAAIDAFKQSLQRDPYSPETHNDLGIVLAQSGHTEEALANFQLALKSHPLYTETYNNRGNTFLQAGRIPEAIKEFQTALQIDPSYVAAHDDLGLALEQSGRIPEAMEQYQLALQFSPEDEKARENLGRLEKLQVQKNASGK
jgi:tetratricopeptide (TPR) repeat protein